jgi:hypothetical protein
LKSRERAAALSRLGLGGSDVHAVTGLEGEVQKMNKMLASGKTAQPAAAFAFLEKTPTELMAFALAGASNSKIVNKIRNYLRRWRPLRLALPTVSLELEALGIAQGAKFDKIMEALFQAQLQGKGRTPEDRTKLLRKLAGIKEPPKVTEEKKKPLEKVKKKLTERPAPALAAPPEKVTPAVVAHASPKHQKANPHSGGHKAKKARRR